MARRHFVRLQQFARRLRSVPPPRGLDPRPLAPRLLAPRLLAPRLLPLLLALLLPGCDAQADRPGTADSDSAADVFGADRPAADRADRADATTGAATAALPLVEHTVNVTLTEWFIALDSDVVDAGTVTFAVVNGGQYAHALEVDGTAWQTEEILPGGSAILEMTLEPGTWTLTCPVYDEHGAHHEMGMRATLIVR